MSWPKVFTFRTHKAGETENDCEDSVYPTTREPSDRLFAVADGATQSFYSGVWAEQLTRCFAQKPDEAFGDWTSWLSEPQRVWREEVQRRAETALDDVFVSNNLNERRPAAATFVGLRLLSLENGGGGLIPWEALVLGDSCLFHLRHDAQVRSYLKQKAADFNFVTESAESYPKTSIHKPIRLPDSKVDDAEWNGAVAAQAGDVFLLATDAFSKWMLSREEAGKPVWGVVAWLEGETEFQRLVRDAREDAQQPLENDDVALAVVRFGEPHAVFANQKYSPAPKQKDQSPTEGAHVRSESQPVRSAVSQRKEEPDRPAPPLGIPAKLPIGGREKVGVRQLRRRHERKILPGITLGVALLLALSVVVNVGLLAKIEKSTLESQALQREKSELIAENKTLKAELAKKSDFQKLEIEESVRKSVQKVLQSLASSIPQLSKEFEKIEQAFERVVGDASTAGADNKHKRTPEHTDSEKTQGPP